MAREYTDLQYKDASQIAFIYFLEEEQENLGPREEPYSVAELVTSHIDVDEAREIRAKLHPGEEVGKSDPIAELKDLIKYSSNLSAAEKSTLLNISNDSYNWKFLASRDRNAETGFYGCVLETSTGNGEKGDLMVAFRGSDSLQGYDQTQNDWDKSDFGLLNGKTPQHKEVEKFAKQVQGLLPDYEGKQIDVAGHSLGGNLTTYFTMYTAKENREIFDRIHKSYNLDGPGYQTEFLENEFGKHAKEAAKKIVHYKACTIGNLIYDTSTGIEGEDIRYVHVNEEKIKEFFLLKPIYRHDTHYWEFNEDGSIKQDSEADPTSKAIGGLSRFIDDYNLEPIAYGFASFIFEWVLGPDLYGDTTITPKGMALLITAAAPIMGSPAGPIIGMIVTFIGAKYMVEKFQVKEQAEEFMKDQISKIKAIGDKRLSFLDNYYNKIKSYLSNNGELLTSKMNIGLIYAMNNPVVIVDTTKLRQYAAQIDKINQRLSNLDQRIKYLYDIIGILDIFKILHADYYIGYNNILKKCSKYLVETANDFEQTEKNIDSAFR